MPELLQASHDTAGEEELLTLHGLHLTPHVMPRDRCSHYSGTVDHRHCWNPQPSLLRAVLQNVVHNGLLQAVIVVLQWSSME